MVGAAFLVAGPECALRDLRLTLPSLRTHVDISMVAGEAQNPRKVMPRAFNSIIYRLIAFFILGALATGIVVPYNDPSLLSNTRPTAAGSPYGAQCRLV
jgi:amino acid transporter